MPAHKPPQNELDVLLQRTKKIGDVVDALKYRHRPTAPIYDFDALPADAVEGQHAVTTDGCYAWYQGGKWHEVCPDEGDPLVAVPAYTVVANQINDAQLTVTTSSFISENITLIGNIPNNWIVFGFASVGSVTRLEGTRKYYLASSPINSVLGGLTSFVSNPGFVPSWEQRIGVGPSAANQLDSIVNILNDNSGPILSASAWGRNETGSTLVAGTNILQCQYGIGSDGGGDILLGPRAYIFIAFDPSVLVLNPNQPGFLFNKGMVGRGYQSDILIRKLNNGISGTVVSNPGFEKDILNIFGVATRATTDRLNFTSSRATKLASAHAGTTGGAYADKTEHWLYVCARGVAAGIYSSVLPGRSYDIRIPFTSKFDQIPWAVSGLGIHLPSSTPL